MGLATSCMHECGACQPGRSTSTVYRGSLYMCVFGWGMLGVDSMNKHSLHK